MVQNKLEPPERPFDEDCCQGGCQNCVWDVYYEAMEKFKEAVVKQALTQLETKDIQNVDQHEEQK